MIRARALKLCPGFFGLIEVGHVGHGAAGAQVREDDPDGFIGKDVSALGHEMHAAEDDELGVFLLGGLAGELEAVAGEVGEIDNGVLLIMMPEDDQPGAQRIFCLLDAKAQLRVRELGIDRRERLLPGFGHQTKNLTT